MLLEKHFFELLYFQFYFSVYYSRFLSSPISAFSFLRETVMLQTALIIWKHVMSHGINLFCAVLLFLARVGLICNMLSDLSHCISDSLYVFFQMIDQMILVFHRNSSFFWKYSNLQFYYFFFKILQIIWDRWNWDNLWNQEVACL